MCDSDRWTRKDHEEIEVYGGADTFILRQGEEGTAVGEICRKAGISEAAMLKAIHASEDLAAAREKAIRVIEKLRGLRLSRAAELVEAGNRGDTRLLRLPGGALAADSHQQSARAHPA